MQVSLGTMAAVYGITADAQLAVKARVGRATARRSPPRVDRLLARDYPGLESLSNAAASSSSIADPDQPQFGLFNAIVAIAVLVSLLGVVNTLAMSVLERTREIGVLRALGASRWHVRGTMVDESLLITLRGGDRRDRPRAADRLRLGHRPRRVLPGIAFRFPVATMVMVAIAAVVLGVLAAVLPARRAARLNPVEALSYE